MSFIGTVGAAAVSSPNAYSNQQINAVVPINELLCYWTLFMVKGLKLLLGGMGVGATIANVNKPKFSGIKVVIQSSLTLDQFNSFVPTQVDQMEQPTLMNLQFIQDRDLLPRLMHREVVV
jgi:type I restriction enzyme S subunit